MLKQRFASYFPPVMIMQGGISNIYLATWVLHWFTSLAAILANLLVGYVLKVWSDVTRSDWSLWSHETDVLECKAKLCFQRVNIFSYCFKFTSGNFLSDFHIFTCFSMSYYTYLQMFFLVEICSSEGVIRHPHMQQTHERNMPLLPHFKKYWLHL